MWYFSGKLVMLILFSLSYVSTRYSRMAPDSHSVMPVFGSSMEGVRPLGLMLM